MKLTESILFFYDFPNLALHVIFSKSKIPIRLQFHISLSLSEVGLLTPAWAELDPCIVGRWVGGGEGLKITADNDYNDGDDEDGNDDDNDNDDDDSGTVGGMGGGPANHCWSSYRLS